MKLVVKNLQGENLNLDVLPEDTFIDVQKRLLESGITLDMAKLATPNKPFIMSANVVEYFGIEKMLKPENETKNVESIATIDLKTNESVDNSQQSSFDITSDSKSVEEKGEKLNELPLKGSGDHEFRRSEEQVNDEDELSNAFQINLENVPFPGKS